MTIAQKLTRVANRVDAKGLHSLADQVDELIKEYDATSEIDSMLPLEKAVEMYNNPLSELMHVANRLDRQGLTALADQADKLIELEALKHQSAIEAILGIYQEKHKIAGLKGFTKKSQEFWQQNDPDWWKESPEEGYPPPSPEEVRHNFADYLLGDYLEGIMDFNKRVSLLKEWDPMVSFEDAQVDDYSFMNSFTEERMTPQYAQHYYYVVAIYKRLKETSDWKELISNFDSQLNEHLRDVGADKERAPSTEELKQMFKFEKIKSFTKKTANIRKDNLPQEQRCPFGLKIPTACMHAGALIFEMEPEEESFKDNRTLYNKYKPGEACPFAAEIFKDKQAVNCTHGTPLAGRELPVLYHSSPIYPKLWEGFSQLNLDRSWNNSVDFSNYSFYG